MESVHMLPVVLSIITLLSVATLTLFILRKSKFPYTVALVCIGIALGYLSQTTEVFSFLSTFSFSPELVLYIFLPTLIFESSFHINFRQFRQNIQVITWISTIGLIISAGIIAAVLHYILGFPIITSLLFGALISPTDPIAVIALFKKVGAPKRLTTIVEGESLANDGMALVFFQLMLGFAITDTFSGFNITTVATSLVLSIFGGVLVGGTLGVIFSKMLDYVKNSKEIEISITLILAHVTFLIAEYFFQVSGVLATVAAGLVIGNYGAYKISPAVKEIMIHFWDYMAFIANSLLFLIMGMLIWKVQGNIAPLFSSIIIVLITVLAARACITYMLVPIINILSPKERIPFAWMHVIHWSGLRGALVMALVLTLPPDLPFYNEILIFSVSVIFFTIVVNGITMEPLLSRLGIKSLSITEAFEYDEAKVLIDKKVNEKFDAMLKKGFIQTDIHKKVKTIYNDDADRRLDQLHILLHSDNQLSQKDISDIIKRHLFGIERRIYHKLYMYGEVTQDLLHILLQTLDVQTETSFGQKVTLARVTMFHPKGIVGKILTKLGMHTIVSHMKKKEVMLRFEMYRARIIGTTYVLQEIEELRASRVFLDDHVLDTFVALYEEWNANARTKLDTLKLQDELACDDVKLFLAKKVAQKIEEQSIEEFYKFGIISEKVKSKLYAEMDERYAQKLI
jgi:CPA1 family monovalent cation:H+ antiporter